MNLRLHIQSPQETRHPSAQRTLLMVSLFLRSFSLSTTLRLLRLLSHRPSKSSSASSAGSVFQFLRRESRHSFFQIRCLEFAVAAWFMLRRSGYPAELVIGVRLLDGRLTSHAWVELESRNPDSEDRSAKLLFTPFLRYR